MQGEVSKEGPIYRQGEIYRLRNKNLLPLYAEGNSLLSRHDIDAILTVSENNDVVSALFEDLAINIQHPSKAPIHFPLIISELKHVLKALNINQMSSLRIRIIGGESEKAGSGALVITHTKNEIPELLCAVIGHDPSDKNVFSPNNGIVIFTDTEFMTKEKIKKATIFLGDMYAGLPFTTKFFYRKDPNLGLVESVSEEMTKQGTLFGVLKTTFDTDTGLNHRILP